MQNKNDTSNPSDQSENSLFTTKSFFSFRQNNSGGHFDPPAVHVFVEADNADQACDLVPFSVCNDDYDSCGCCECCGHRWYEPYEKEEIKDILWTIDNNDVFYHIDRQIPSIALVFKNGEILVADSAEKLAEIREFIAKSAAKSD